MSIFYRCDAPGCEAEAPHPGIDWSDEMERHPDGWKRGPKGDFCPAHPMRLATGECMWVTHPRLPGGHDFVAVDAFNATDNQYGVLITYPSADRPARRVWLAASVVEQDTSATHHLAWVPR